MVAPVRFETVAKWLNISAEVVHRWSTIDGFPAAGEGVADPDVVDKWALDGGHYQALMDAPPEDGPGLFSDSAPGSAGCITSSAPPAAPAAVASAVASSVAGVTWLTIRVPVKLDGPRMSSASPYQTMRLKSCENHIRLAMGQLHAGCRESHQQMGTGELVDKISQSCKWLFEQLAFEIQKIERDRVV